LNSHKSVKRRVDTQNSVIEFLTEFARYLLAAGVSISQFQGAAQRAFLMAAARDAQFANAKLNQSAVAAMTGLTRAQVRSILRLPVNAYSHRVSRVDQMVTGWLTDPVFTTAAGNARVLQRNGRGRTFAALAKKYGGDVPPRALLAELLRQGIVRTLGTRIALSNTARRAKEPVELSHLAVALANLIGRNEQSIGRKGLKLLGAKAIYATPVAAGRILLQKRISQGLKAFVADVEAAGAAIAKASRGKGATARRMSTTSILLVSKD
jgi:Family of unknown function (DUF6502)